MRLRRVAPALVVALAVSCSAVDGQPAPPAELSAGPGKPPSASPSVQSRPSAQPAPSLPATRPAPTSSPPYSVTVSTISRERLPHSWRPGCPISPEGLRLLTLNYWGFDGVAHRGELVVNARYAVALGGVFRSLYGRRFPIARMQLVDEYGGNDDRSTAANNTSAFNCRPPYGSARGWSQHAYGAAVDLNPVQNPYVYADGHVLDPNARPYVARSTARPGMILPRDRTVAAFAAIGWRWGGYWNSAKDYQHFSANGR